ncbi:hypothetical protein [uncultured Dysgonomonas sp.]|uniref:hypothetical protein n=1 Tax=uncultured Dysgonomonas sp. TaxID=206096 RepID=UPI000A8B1801|nr:hypothetical protein [uncultured Dysgonomonas sp.]
MRTLNEIIFQAKCWHDNSKIVTGKMTFRDRETLQLAGDVNIYGYVVCIENDEGVHIVHPASLTQF